MFVQALADYADDYLSARLSDEAFEEKPVTYLIELTPDGEFVNITQNSTPAVRGKKTVFVPTSLTIPKSPVPRNAGLYPLLAADDIKYVLGAGAWTAKGQEKNNQERHEAFVDLIREAARETNDEALKSCAAFYDCPLEVERARQALVEAKAGSLVALSVAGPVVKRNAVRDFWRARYRAVATDRSGKTGIAECLISGRVGPIAPTHDKIKGLASLGGQPSGVSLMSFDKDAFCSYGWEQNANSPVSPERATAYVLALNDLLRSSGSHRRDIAGVGFIFWTKEPTDFDPMATVDQPDERHVQQLLSFNPLADPDPNMFYMAGVAGNGGRMLIRYWAAETLTDVKRNLRAWFSDLRVANVFTGQPARPPKLWQLLRAIDRDGGPPADRLIALLRRAIQGPSQVLGHRMLAAALTRLRCAHKEQRLDPVRMGLIRLCLNDLISKKEGEIQMSENLDAAQNHPAYLSGRLLAVYEGLQYAASEQEVNQTVTDRYFSLASTYPALAFPKLEDLGHKHLRKLRRDIGTRGAWVRIGEEIDRLHVEIEQACGFRFPAALDLDGQGRFALGYHHQRARQMAEARARKAARQEISDSPKNQEN